MKSKNERSKILDQTEVEASKIENETKRVSGSYCTGITLSCLFIKKYASTYVMVMKRIIEKGESFVDGETKRIVKNLEDKSIKENVKTGMRSRQNILESFKYPTEHIRLIDEL